MFILSLIIIYILPKNNKGQFINYNNFKLDKIYVINLNKNKDRWDVISKAAKKANIPITRFNAIYGKELPPNHPDIIKYFDKNNKLNSGQIGCALSHIKILEEAVKNNYDNILVFEDDAIIPPDFWEKLEPVVNELPDDWDILSLNCVRCKGKKYKYNLYKLLYNICLMGYIISKSGIIKLIKLLNKKIKIPIDNFLATQFYSQNNCYIIDDSLILPNSNFKSDINVGDGGAGKHIIQII